MDGVYSADPVDNPDAVRYDALTYDQVLEQKLGVMDLTAITMCAEGNLAVTVFDVSDPENLQRVLAGEAVGTRITKET